MGYDYSSFYAARDYSTTALDTTLFGAAMGVIIFALLVGLVIAIIQLIAMWKLYKKAGQAGWKSIIPIYNLVTLFKIAGLSPWLILVYLLMIVPFIGWIAGIALTAILCYKLALSFGKDIGWAVGLYFLAPIFYMILAFGKSEYVGPGGEGPVEVNTAE